MSLTPLTALSPVDGRYAGRCADLREIFSEQGLIRARVRVEVAWLHALVAERQIEELRGITAPDLALAQQLADGFSPQDAARTVADVAVETIKARGEPARYERLLGEILVGMDRAGQLRRLLAADGTDGGGDHE